MNEQNIIEDSKEAKQLLYLINLTFESMKVCGSLNNNLYTKDIDDPKLEDMIKSLALSEIRKQLGI